MAWYYWLYIAATILWFLDLYSSTVRTTKPKIYADLVVIPLIAALYASVWPVTLVFLLWKSRKVARDQS